MLKTFKSLFMTFTDDPVLILGMHRSGTSIIAEVLNQSGLFLGNKLNVHYESEFFLEKNTSLLNVAHSEWDYPLLFKLLLENKDVRNNAAQHLIAELKNKKAGSAFFGLKNQLLKNKMSWGWKEPRTTITFPVWLNVFPNAKIIFINRNGVDVALSLQAREQKRKLKLNGKLSIRCLNLDESFKLWEEYLSFYYAYLKQFPYVPVLEIKYEEFMINPVQELKKILDFINLKEYPQKTEQAGKKIDKLRAYSFINNVVGIELYDKVKDTFYFKKLGYDKIDVPHES